MQERTFDFDLRPKVEAIADLDAPKVVKKVLRALAVFGCANHAAVVIGSGGPDGDWLLSPRRDLIAGMAGVAEYTWTRWLNALESLDSKFLWMKRHRDCEAEFVVFWERVFAAADQRRRSKCAATIPENAEIVAAQLEDSSNCAATIVAAHFERGPAAAASDAGEECALGEVVLKPTKETKEFKDHHQPDQPSTETRARVDREPRSLGTTITPHDLRSPAGAVRIFQAAVRNELLQPRDAEPAIAFLHWVSQQVEDPTGNTPGCVKNRCAFVAAAWTQWPRANWAFRAGPENYRRAREILEMGEP